MPLTQVTRPLNSGDHKNCRMRFRKESQTIIDSENYYNDDDFIIYPRKFKDNNELFLKVNKNIKKSFRVQEEGEEEEEDDDDDNIDAIDDEFKHLKEKIFKLNNKRHKRSSNININNQEKEAEERAEAEKEEGFERILMLETLAEV